MTKPKFDVYWQCKCGYLMSQTQYKATVIDFKCSRCNEHRLSSYEMRRLQVIEEVQGLTTKLEDVSPSGFKYEEFN